MEDAEMREFVRAEVERRVRSQITRYLPLLAVGVVIALLVVLVPDYRPTDGAGALTSATGPGGSLPAGVAAGPGALPGGAAIAGQPGSGVAVGQPGGGPGTVAGTGPSGASPVGPGTTTSRTGTASAYGVARNGTHCGPGVRQFSFTPYAPPCVPAFTANNGGSTAHGVDGKAITLAFRETSDYDSAAPAVGASSQAAIEADLRTLITYFNSQYELYGRQAVLKTYSGSGSYVAETAGQDQSGASADAQKEYDLGAFVDLGPPAPAVYANALAARKIVTFGQPLALADARTSYPYKFQSLSAVPDLLARGVADMICQRMAGQRATHAGDASLSSKTRTFALIDSDTYADGQGPNALFTEAKAKCGLSVEHFTYNPNPAQGAAQAAQIAQKMKADGITTVILNADVIFQPTMTTAVGQQQYNPEWVVFGPNSNAAPRKMDAKQVSRMIFAFPWHPLAQNPAATESARIFALASPHAGPQSNQVTLDLLIKPLIELFDAVQAAGPTLTPATFGRGWFSQPQSAKAGDFGSWSFGPDMFSPDASFTLQQWDPAATNPYDGKAGTPVACNEPADIPLSNPSLGAGQLHCLGN